VQNGHCLLFLIDKNYVIPRFALGRSFVQQKSMIERFVKATVRRFPQIAIWTLNEPIVQSCFGWSREQNYEVFVAASKWIHEVKPEAKVMVNMIPIRCRWSGLDYEPNKVLDDLLARGLQADIIGIELYYWWAKGKNCDGNGYPRMDWVKSRVDMFRRYGLPIIFSEVGVPGIMKGREQFDKQADWAETFFRFCHDDKDVIGATWYFVRDNSFMPYAGLVNDDYTLRPVAERLIALANEWNPTVTHQAQRGYLDLDAGRYDLIVNEQVYRVSVREGKVISLPP